MYIYQIFVLYLYVAITVLTIRSIYIVDGFLLTILCDIDPKLI